MTDSLTQTAESRKQCGNVLLPRVHIFAKIQKLVVQRDVYYVSSVSTG